MFGNDAPPGMGHAEIRRLSKIDTQSFLVDDARVGSIDSSVPEVRSQILLLIVELDDVVFYRGCDALEHIRVLSLLNHMGMQVRQVIFGDLAVGFDALP